MPTHIREILHAVVFLVWKFEQIKESSSLPTFQPAAHSPVFSIRNNPTRFDLFRPSLQLSISTNTLQCSASMAVVLRSPRNPIAIDGSSCCELVYSPFTTLAKTVKTHHHVTALLLQSTDGWRLCTVPSPSNNQMRDKANQSFPKSLFQAPMLTPNFVHIMEHQPHLGIYAPPHILSNRGRSRNP